MRCSAVILCLGGALMLAIGCLAATEYRGVNMALEMAHVSDLEFLAIEWNANLVRLCLYMAGEWGYFVPSREAPTTFLDSHWERLDAFLDDCERLGIRVVIDLHQWLGYQYLNDMSGSQFWGSSEYQDAFVEFWELVARRYADRGEVIYGYDLLNEPHADYGGQPLADRWHSLAQRTVDAIRQYDQEHAVIIDCTDWGNPSGFNYLRPIDDENVIYSFHMWLPHQFTHQGVNNQRTGVRYPTSTWDKGWLREQMQPVLDFQREHSARIFAGEVGAGAIADEEDRAAYFRDCLELFEEFGFDYAQWCYMEWGNWSLEHSPATVEDSLQTAYAGSTPSLKVWLEFFARNERATTSSTDRPRCLFVQSGKPGTWTGTVASGDLLWKLDHAFEVIRHDGPIGEADLAGIDVLVLGAEREGYTTAEMSAIDVFVRNGGGLLHYGSSADDLMHAWLSSAGVFLHPAVIASRPHEWDVASFLCYTVADHPITEQAMAYHTNWSGSVSVTDGGTILVWSPETSWRDDNWNRQQDTDEPLGPFGLVAAQELGRGRIVVMADDAFNLTANYAITLGAAMWLAGR